ncbi:uncharacterized protein LY89DRAFT_757051 [Mollisia scopiformis]|uniref:Uncharacterized protein n=1 Tax=Mollisia scopiformis TaxID=149040 RepID=A0A194WX23_MOLSC|nr:uncharacterized protein LY89DRAFT_757051 [Mollisia scopiformis]KUJ12531.1 hypothetical protein LY89DRAFT_757051 [Mollisia scopiformis]
MAMPNMAFTVTDYLDYKPNFISSFYQNVYSPGFVERQAITAIEEFLSVLTPLVPDNVTLQPPGISIAGNVTLPLVVQTPRFNVGCNLYPAYRRLIIGLSDVIRSCHFCFRNAHPKEFDLATDFLKKVWENTPSEQLIDTAETSCFYSMRLTSNLAVESRPLMSDHQSPWCVLTSVGDWTNGRTLIPRLYTFPRLTVYGTPGDTIIVSDGVEVGNESHTGNRFQLEFFLPPSVYGGDGEE